MFSTVVSWERICFAKTIVKLSRQSSIKLFVVIPSSSLNSYRNYNYPKALLSSMIEHNELCWDNRVLSKKINVVLRVWKWQGFPQISRKHGRHINVEQTPPRPAYSFAKDTRHTLCVTQRDRDRWSASFLYIRPFSHYTGSRWVAPCMWCGVIRGQLTKFSGALTRQAENAGESRRGAAATCKLKAARSNKITFVQWFEISRITKIQGQQLRRRGSLAG